MNIKDLEISDEEALKILGFDSLKRHVEYPNQVTYFNVPRANIALLTHAQLAKALFGIVDWLEERVEGYQKQVDAMFYPRDAEIAKSVREYRTECSTLMGRLISDLDLLGIERPRKEENHG